MSITLMAYPTAFLISPDKANDEKLQIFKSQKNTPIAAEKLHSVRVFTNLSIEQTQDLMRAVNAQKLYEKIWQLNHNLKIEWIDEGNFATAILSGCESAEELQRYGESFFQNADKIFGYNVREIRSKETFYYEYETEYTDVRDIKPVLKKQGAKEISVSDDETSLSAKLQGDNIKYYKRDGKFFLEVEKRISIVNININNEVPMTAHRQSAFSSVKIETNIEAHELAYFLQLSGYRFMRANGQTPLKTPYSTLNWYLENGKYTAEFSGTNQQALNAEIEDIFKKLNMFAKRDVRFVDNLSKTVYTYNTNYTDKNILINTLLEHGASNLEEKGDNVGCRIFDMDMNYVKKDDGSFALEITRVTDKSECENLVKDLNEEYGLNIQEMTYNKIKERLEAENLRLEDETVLEDNSIVLTIDVG